jgi:hypothetical protein
LPAIADVWLIATWPVATQGHSWQGHIPVLARELDIPDVVAMRCPMPSMVQHDRGDALFTLANAEEGLGHVRESFEKGGCAENFVGSLYDGPHKFDLEMQAEAFAWFDRWLLPTGADTPLALLHRQVAEGPTAAAELSKLEAQRAALDARIAELRSTL